MRSTLLFFDGWPFMIPLLHLFPRFHTYHLFNLPPPIFTNQPSLPNPPPINPLYPPPLPIISLNRGSLSTFCHLRPLVYVYTHILAYKQAAIGPKRILQHMFLTHSVCLYAWLSRGLLYVQKLVTHFTGKLLYKMGHFFLDTQLCICLQTHIDIKTSRQWILSSSYVLDHFVCLYAFLP